MQVTPASALPGHTLHAAQLANGGHVVVWTSNPTAANRHSVVYAQLFDADDQKQGAPITVFAAPEGSFTGFSSSGVAGLPDGSFLVSGNDSGSFTQGWSRLFVQKVSATGQLLATGGVSVPSVNGGLADQLLFDTDMSTAGFSGGPIFANPDGSYVLAVTKIVYEPGSESTQGMLLNVDSGGNVVGAPVDLVGHDYISAPAVVRLTGGNFMVAGTSSSYPSAYAVIKIVTNTGQEIGRQTLLYVSGIGITALADGTGLVWWYANQPQPAHVAQERIDANGGLAGTAPMPQPGAVRTGLSAGGYVATWPSGSQLFAQYFTSSGQASGDAFLVADNCASMFAYAVTQTPDGFSVVYEGTTSSGPQIFEIRTAAPPLN